MEANKQMSVPYIVYEAMLEKEDRQQRRLVGVIILLVVLLVASNAFWVYEWNSYDYVETEEQTQVELEAEEGNANYIGRDGTITNAPSKGNNNQEDQEPHKEGL